MKRKSSLLFVLIIALIFSTLTAYKINQIKNSDKDIKITSRKISLNSNALLPQLKVCVVDQAPMNCINNFFQGGVGKYYTKDLVNQLFLYRKAEPRATEYCHDIALLIGTASWAEYKEPLKALSAGTPVCASGYLHGLQEGIGADNTLSEGAMMDDLHIICDELTGKEDYRSSMYKVCYHGIGHALNKRFGLNTATAFKVCEKLSGDPVSIPDVYEQKYTKRELCAEGVSMRYFESLTSKSEKFTNDLNPGLASSNVYSNPYSICDSNADISIRYACFEYATRSFLHTPNNYKKIVNLCNYYSDADQLPCFFGLSRELAYSPDTKSYDNVVNYCLKARSPDAAYFCAQNAILNRITIDNDIVTPVKVCEKLPVTDVTKKICSKVAISLKLTSSENSRNF